GVTKTTSAEPSAATARSSSVIAAAIHVTSWWSSSPRKAVTSPPPPRFSIRAPSPSRSYVTGPRFETRISRRRSGTAPLQPLGEPEARAAVGALGDLELVGERFDDRDPEAAFREVVRVERRRGRGRGLEALATVAHLDDEPVGMELVDDLHDPVAVAVRMPD